MTILEYKNYLVEWLKNVVTDAKMSGIIVGISGGIDSALAINLAKEAFPDNVLGVIIPIETSDEDINDAINVAKNANVEYVILDLNELFHSFESMYSYEKIITLANTKSRLRMIQLYALASENNYLVCGTDNKCEWFTGFFTKYGDGGVDVAPLIHLNKDEVYEMARLYNVPEQIFKKSPSAGLGLSNTDEEELGVSYKTLNSYLNNEEISEKEKLIIENLNERTKHKRELALKPNDFRL